MAKFVLAGKVDCPHFAKAELLADLLQGSLPNFRIHKVSIQPEDWPTWMEDTCSRNQWKLQRSPFIWRELVDRGGKGMLLGGYSDFMEHCQDFYGIRSDMMTEMMLSIAAENLETSKKLKEEEKTRLSLIQPLHVWISSALSPVCAFLIPHLLSTEVFPHASSISLHLLDLTGDEEELQELKMETEDLVLPLLYQVTVHTQMEEAFDNADVILMLDELWSEGHGEKKRERTVQVEQPQREPEDVLEVPKKRGQVNQQHEEQEGEGQTKLDKHKHTEQMKRMASQYQEYAQLIDIHAKRKVKVIVAGDAFVNLRCSLLQENAPSIPSHCFIATATQLEYEARAIIAQKLNVRTSDVTNVTVWGNISGTFYVDLERAKVFHYNGAISGPDFFFQTVTQMLHDKRWLNLKFQGLVKDHRAIIAAQAGRPPAMSAANGILSVLKAWSGSEPPTKVLSAGVQGIGHYDLPGDVVCSAPMTFSNGEWTVLPGVTVGDELRDRLRFAAEELRQEQVEAARAVVSEDTENSDV